MFSWDISKHRFYIYLKTFILSCPRKPWNIFFRVNNKHILIFNGGKIAYYAECKKLKSEL